MEEIWRDVVRKKPLAKAYQVSNLGNVRFETRGEYDFKTWRLAKLKLCKDKDGEYLTVNLQGKCNSVVRVDYLVARAFVANPHRYTRVRHYDGNSLNNRADNLIWYKQLMPCVAEPVHQYTRDGKFVKEYASVSDARLACEVHISGISRCCGNEPGKFTCGGFVWRHATDTDFYNMPEIERAKLIRKNWRARSSTKNRDKGVRQYTLDGKLVAEFGNLASAASESGLARGSLSCCCRKVAGHHSCGGFLWRYEDNDEFSEG